MEEATLPLNELIIESDCFSEPMRCAEGNQSRNPSSKESTNEFSKKFKNSLSDDRNYKKSFKSGWSLEDACNIPEWHPPQQQSSSSTNEIFLNGSGNCCPVKSSASSGSLSASPPPFVPRNLNIPPMHSHQILHSGNVCPHQGASNSRSPPFHDASENQEEGSNKPHHAPYVVNVYVNPHASFTVSVGDQVQVIQGPATVRMVSPLPPLPTSIPEQPGQLVHQIVDDNGILTQVIISCQNNPPIMNSSPQSPYAPPPFMVMHPPSYHQHHPRHHHPTPSNNGTNSNLDQRALKRKERLQMKLNQRKGPSETAADEDVCDGNNAPKPESRVEHSQNGAPAGHKAGKDQAPQKVENNSTSSSVQFELALSKIDDPKILVVEARSAVVRLNWCESSDLDIDPMKVKYRLFINKGKDDGPSFTEVYSGDAQEIALNDLMPATTYYVKYQCWLDDSLGCLSPTVSFTTCSSEPEPPSWPKLISKTKSTLQLKWNAAVDNGSKVTSYVLEYDEGRGSSKFVELYNGSQKQFKVTKLQPSTGYRFRLAAMNIHGKSVPSDSICYSTNGPVPSQTDPPMMSEPMPRSLTVSWIKRPSDESFTLQMEDESTGHGFLTVYNGPDMSYKVNSLARNTEYKFRLQAKNEEGSSKWSEVVGFKTLPERPFPPHKLQVKGKALANCFKFVWDEPKDAGGVDVDHYVVFVDTGDGFRRYMETTDREATVVDLVPGQSYKVKVQARSNGGVSEFSETLVASTQPVPPSQCRPPKLHKGRSKPTHFCVSWEPPENDGGAAVVDYVVVLKNPDSSSRETYRGGELSCVVAGVLPGESYQVQVRAINKAGLGPWSEPFEVTTGSSAPEPPSRPEVVAQTPHSAFVTWSPPKSNGSEVIEYRLEWKFVQNLGLNDDDDDEGDRETSDGDNVDDDEEDYSLLFCGSTCSYEVGKLVPASKYSFRVLAINGVGPSAASLPTTYRTPPGSPSAVSCLHADVATATSVKLTWKRPKDNGAPISSYHIDLGGGKTVVVEAELTEFVVEGLAPDTLYKIRIQGMNAVGVGPYGPPVKVTTRNLPPDPPKLEVLSCGPKFIKFKWGDSKSPELLQFCLEMSRDGEDYHVAYQGTGRSHKVSKLNEATEYFFRIFAANEAGDGPLSAPLRIITGKSSPPCMKAPHVAEVGATSCIVQWVPLRAASCGEQFIYILQILDRFVSDSFQEIYRGELAQFHLVGLVPNSEYRVRICAMRICSEDNAAGPYSASASFNTRPALPLDLPRVQAKQYSSAHSSTRSAPLLSGLLRSGRKLLARVSVGEGMTEMHWAILLMFAFALVAALLALVAKYIVDLNVSHSSSQ